MEEERSEKLKHRMEMKPCRNTKVVHLEAWWEQRNSQVRQKVVRMIVILSTEGTSACLFP